MEELPNPGDEVVFISASFPVTTQADIVDTGTPLDIFVLVGCAKSSLPTFIAELKAQQCTKSEIETFDWDSEFRSSFLNHQHEFSQNDRTTLEKVLPDLKSLQSHEKGDYSVMSALRDMILSESAQDQEIIDFMRNNKDVLRRRMNDLNCPPSRHIITLLTGYRCERIAISRWLSVEISEWDPNVLIEGVCCLSRALVLGNTLIIELIASDPRTDICYAMNTVSGSNLLNYEDMHTVLACHPIPNNEQTLKDKITLFMDKYLTRDLEEYSKNPRLTRHKLRKEKGYNIGDSARLFSLLRLVEQGFFVFAPAIKWTQL